MPPPDALDPGTPPPDDPDRPDATDEPTGRPDAPRAWVHPSELAMQARSEEDRRRRRRVPALAFVGVGAVVVAAGIALGWGWVPAPERSPEIAAAPPDVVPLVVVSASGTSTRSGVVVGPDGLILMRATDVQPPAEVYVLVAGRDPLRAQVAGSYPELGLTVLAPLAEVGRPTEAAEPPAVGDSVVVYSASGAERSPARWTADVSATDVDEQLPDGTVRRELLLLRRSAADDPDRATSTDDGIVYDAAGRLVGVVVSQRNGSGELVVARSPALDAVAGSSISGATIESSRLASTTAPGG